MINTEALPRNQKLEYTIINRLIRFLLCWQVIKKLKPKISFQTNVVFEKNKKI